MSSRQLGSSQPNAFTLELDNGLTIQGKHWPASEEGRDLLPTLALHGWLDNCATYNLLGPALHGDIYAVDLAGHGCSSHRPAGVRYHLLDNVDDVFAIADALGFEQFNLMGHSMGAGISTYTAAIAPERIHRLILIEGIGTHTSPAEQGPDVLAKAVKDMRRAHRINMPVYKELTDAVNARKGVVGAISADAATHLCERGLVDVPNGVTWSSDPRLKMGSAIRLTEDMVMAYLKKIAAPTLLVGAEQGFFPSIGPLKLRVEAIAELTLLTLPGNHHLHLEEGTCLPVIDAINAFLLREVM